MKRRTFTILCGEGHCGKIAAILEKYANVAYPAGGSECAAAARSALLDIAERLALANDQVAIGSRQRPMIIAAMKWYFEEVERFAPQQREALMNSLSLRRVAE